MTFSAPATGAFVRDTPHYELVVSIINYRTADLTIECVKSILGTSGSLDVCIVVTDNRSGDGSAEKVEAWIESTETSVPIVLVKSPRNTGFSGGHNVALTGYRGDFYLILNSDALLRLGCLDGLLAAARKSPRTGILAPRLEWQDTSPQISCFRLPTLASELIRGAATGPVTKALTRHDLPLGVDPRPEDIGWVSFACVLLRQEMLAEIGCMDDGFFLYFEDVEFCWRARQAGWEIAYIPQARVVHLRGGSAPVKKLAAMRARLPRYFYASRTRLFYRLHGRLGLLGANVLWTTGRLIAWTRALVGKPVPKSVESEWRDLWTNFRAPLRSGQGYGE